MKIEIFRAKNTFDLVDKVNDFIKNKQVIDIKYKSEFVATEYAKNGVPASGNFYESVLVMYM